MSFLCEWSKIAHFAVYKQNDQRVECINTQHSLLCAPLHTKYKSQVTTVSTSVRGKG